MSTVKRAVKRERFEPARMRARKRSSRALPGKITIARPLTDLSRATQRPNVGHARGDQFWPAVCQFPAQITHKSVKGDRSKKKEKKKENSRLSEYKAHSSMGILFIYLSILSFTEKVHALVRKLGSDSVKAHHLQRLHIRRFLTAVFSLARFIYRLGPRGLRVCAHVKYENKN